MRSDHHLAVDPVDHHRRQMRKQNPRQQHAQPHPPRAPRPADRRHGSLNSGARGFTESASELLIAINDGLPHGGQ